MKLPANDLDLLSITRLMQDKKLQRVGHKALMILPLDKTGVGNPIIPLETMVTEMLKQLSNMGVGAN